MGTYFYSLLFVTAVAAIDRLPINAATAGALFVNWGLNSTIAAYCIAQGDPYPYPYYGYMMFDYLTGLAIVLIIPLSLHKSPNKWQVAITLIYAAQLMWHMGYMWSNHDAAAKYMSWYFLSWTAWAQLIIAGAWCVNSICRHVLNAIRNVSPDSALRTVPWWSARPEIDQ